MPTPTLDSIASSKTSVTFMEAYRMYCKDKKTKLKVRTMSNETTLDFNIDKLELEDWMPFIKSIKTDRTLQTIIIKSEYIRKKWNNLSFQDGRIHKDEPVPVLFKSNYMCNLIDAIAECLRGTDVLTTLHVEALPMDKNFLEKLSHGARDCKSLQDFAIRYCNLGDAGIQMVLNIIGNHGVINTVDFSGCNLTHTGVKHLSAMIHNQKMIRFSETWKQSLRYREPDPENFPGIRRITLNDNPHIKDEGFKLIKDELMEDLWVKAIDMQNCDLTEKSGNEALELISVNNVILVIDIRNNVRMPERFTKAIKNILIKRYENEHIDPGQLYPFRSDWLEGGSVSDFGKRHRNLDKESIMANSECSFKWHNPTRTTNLTKSTSLTTELHHTKRVLQDTSTILMQERERRIKVERETKELKEQLKDKLLKEWNRRKIIEKERDELKQELSDLYETIPQESDSTASSPRTKCTPPHRQRRSVAKQSKMPCKPQDKNNAKQSKSPCKSQSKSRLSRSKNRGKPSNPSSKSRNRSENKSVKSNNIKKGSQTGIKRRSQSQSHQKSKNKKRSELKKLKKVDTPHVKQMSNSPYATTHHPSTVLKKSAKANHNEPKAILTMQEDKPNPKISAKTHHNEPEATPTAIEEDKQELLNIQANLDRLNVGILSNVHFKNGIINEPSGPPQDEVDNDSNCGSGYHELSPRSRSQFLFNGLVSGRRTQINSSHGKADYKKEIVDKRRGPRKGAKSIM